MGFTPRERKKKKEEEEEKKSTANKTKEITPRILHKVTRYIQGFYLLFVNIDNEKFLILPEYI